MFRSAVIRTVRASFAHHSLTVRFSHARFFSVKRNIVVFDIDDTLCFGLHTKPDAPEILAERQYRNAECTIVQLQEEGYLSTYIFRPYFDILLKYLLSKNVRIAFFSAGVQDRNVPLIETVLTNTLGTDVYRNMLDRGQFEIFSRHQMRPVDPKLETGVKVFEAGHVVKDLTPILKEGETLNDIILLDDNPMYCAHNQPEILYTPYSMYEFKPEYMQINILRFKNHFYYFLGVFKNYFENKDGLYRELSLRQAIKKMVPVDGDFDPKMWVPTSNFELEMVLIGLREVRTVYPEALIYGARTYLHEDPARPAALFHHTEEAIESILDSIINGKRQLTDSTLFMFLRYLEEDGLKFYPQNGSIKSKFDLAVKLLQSLNKQAENNTPAN